MIEYHQNEGGNAPKGTPSNIAVIGVGGAGTNVLDRIALEGMVDAELISMNTDVRDLSAAVSSKKIQIGAEITRGLGAGGDPVLGLRSAAAEEDAIRDAVKGRDLVFVCSGLGGGTGSGAAPYVAKIAREAGAFVVAFSTMPFSFEGGRRIAQAEAALRELQDHSSALIAFDNDRMGQIALDKNGISDAFAAADQIISQSVRAVTSLVTQPGIIRIGMDDIMTALKNTDSRCLFGFGQSTGKNRALEALKAALRSPLLDRGALLKRAANVLVHIAGGGTMTLYEVENTMKELNKHVPESAQILFGVAADPKLEDSLSVTIITSMAGGEAVDPSTAAAEDIASYSAPTLSAATREQKPDSAPAKETAKEKKSEPAPEKREEEPAVAAREEKPASEIDQLEDIPAMSEPDGGYLDAGNSGERRKKDTALSDIAGKERGESSSRSSSESKSSSSSVDSSDLDVPTFLRKDR